MFSILNRFAWMISLLFSLFGWSLLFDSFNERIFHALGFFGWVLVFFGAALIKKIFLSEDFIRSSLGISLASETEDVIHEDTVGENSVRKEGLLSEIVSQSPSDVSHPSEEESLSSPEETTIPLVTGEASTILIPEEPSALGVWIRNFFSDRPLAKVGGILLFLGALFFLYLVFDAVGPVGKVLIGLIFGVALILVGAWIDTKDMKTESRVLLGIGIAVNYLTILSGRHLLSGGSISAGPLFSDTFATLALLLNSALAVVLALAYRSNILLGFSFIFAYATPFLVASESSSVLLLSLYTTILTSTIALILFLYSRMNHTASRSILEGISIIGMTVLFSLAMRHATSENTFVVFIGLILAVLSLGVPLYREKRSPVALLAGTYFVLFIASVSIESILFPIGLITVFIFAFLFVLSSGISLVVYSVLGCVSFVLGLIEFWFHGAHALISLFGTGIALILLFGVALSRIYSSVIGGASILGFAVFLFLGVSTTSLDFRELSVFDMMSIKAMALFLLAFGSVFSLRTRDVTIYFLSVLLSGMLLIYPNIMEVSPSITIGAYIIYVILTFLVPVLLLRSTTVLHHSAWLSASLPVASLVIAYALYQSGHVYFPGIMLGVAYIIQGVISLSYAGFMISYLPVNATLPTKETEDRSSLLLILFAVPLSLFTFSIAFLFRDIPGMMSLAWVVESTILYFVSIQKWDTRIQYAAHMVLIIGLMKELTLIGSFTSGDWGSLPILLVMMVAIFLSLFFFRKNTTHDRVIYDILHVIGVLMIGYSIGVIIPHTNVGWSVFGMTVFIGLVSYFYAHVGRHIHHVFLSILFLGVIFLFLERFDFLDKKSMLPLMVQGVTLLGFLGIGYFSYRTKNPFAWFQLGASIIGTLILSSWYIREFLGTFAVSLYLTIIASVLIIRGIVRDIPILRVIGLYIGIFVLLKIFFHDIWIGNNGTFTRVIALMVTGGTMIYLSQLYGKYVSRSWSEELGISNFFSGGNTNISDPERMETDPFLGVLQQDLSHIDISGYSGIQFQTKNGDQFVVRRVSVLRLAKHITDTYRRTTFQPHELESAYQFVLSNLESTMPKKDLDMLLEKVKMWIEQGGSVNYISKS